MEPKCPKCGASMIKRLAKVGKNAGKEFYGCATFPRCRGTIDLLEVQAKKAKKAAEKLAKDMDKAMSDTAKSTLKFGESSIVIFDSCPPF